MKTILITGAGSGIGRATSVLLSEDPNTRLLLIGRSIESLNETLALTKNSNNHLTTSVDISDASALESFLQSPQAALNEHPLECVFANAGIGGPNDFGSNDRWQQIIDINLTGAYNTCMSCYPWLLKSPTVTKHVVLTSSCLARFGVPGQTAYVASKTALTGLVRSLATTWSKEGILINAIAPGWVDTQMAKNSIQAMADAEGMSYEEMHKIQSNILPTGRMSEPVEIAQLIKFLFSGLQRSIVGQTIDINNGSWMG